MNIEWLSNTFNSEDTFQFRLLKSLIALALLWILSQSLSHFILGRIERDTARYWARKVTIYATTFISFFIVGRVWFAGIDSLATFFGLLSAGIAIALKDPIVNAAGWIYLIWRRPFEAGDRIEIDDHKGDVIDIRLFQFSLLELENWINANQPTGRIVHIPNGKVFVEPQANYSRGLRYIWDEIPVLVTFESDWRKAKMILTRLVERHAEHLEDIPADELQRFRSRYIVPEIDLAARVFSDIEDSGVLLTLRYLVSPYGRRATKEAIVEGILDAFDEHDDIDFAYPTSRFFDHLHEGKQAATEQIG